MKVMYQPIKKIRRWRNYSCAAVQEVLAQDARGKSSLQEVRPSRSILSQLSKVYLWLRNADGFVEILPVIITFLVAMLLTLSNVPEAKTSVLSKSSQTSQHITLD